MVSRRRAFTLVEITFAIAMLSVFMLISAHLFRNSLDTSVNTRDAANRIGTWQAMQRTLRRDAWEARSFVTSDPSLVMMLQPQGRTVTWMIDAKRDNLSRVVTVNGEPWDSNTWSGHGRGMSFSAAGPILTLSIEQSPIRGGGTFSLPSQAQMLEERRP